MNVVIYDIECLSNIFTVCAHDIPNNIRVTFEISPRRNNFEELKKWMQYLRKEDYQMVGFNNFKYDYPVLNWLLGKGKDTDTAEELTDIAYQKSKAVIFSKDVFAHTVWDYEQSPHQLDPFKIHHFDNKNNRVSLKRLEFNMRMSTIEEFSLDFNKPLETTDQMDHLIRYNKHDVEATRRFHALTESAINFRKALIPTFGEKVLNFSDSKLGEESMIKEIADKVGMDKLYKWEETIDGRSKRTPIQTPRDVIPLRSTLLPTIKFKHDEFKDALAKIKTLNCHVIDNKFHWTDKRDYLKGLRRIEIGKGSLVRAKAEGLDDEILKEVRAKIAALSKEYTDQTIECKVGDFAFDIGKGGLHGAREWSSYTSTGDRMIRDVDVTSFYPSIAIQYNIKPEHMPDIFTAIYKGRKDLRLTYPKGTPENKALKLSLNAVYGKSNSKFSPFYDPKYTVSITLNGQLFLLMLWDMLMDVPTTEIIQANTDGITYSISRQYLDDARKIEKQWEKITRMDLEDAEYRTISLRDVNNYVCEDVDSKVKMKGAYNYQELNYGQDNISMVVWKKNHSAIAVKKAAVDHLLNGTDVEDSIMSNRDVFDFFLCTNLNRSSRLMWGDEEIQRISRYLITNEGEQLYKIMPPLKGKEEKGERWFKINKGFNTQIFNTVTENDTRKYDINYSWYIDEVNELLKGF